MRKRMEDKIRRLCQEAISEQDPDEFTKIIFELRAALRAHIEALRRRLSVAELTERRASTPEVKH